MVRIVTNNIGGLQEAWDWIFELDVEILMIQETKLTTDKISGKQLHGYEMGWHGVWEPALVTEKGGISGGIATLVRQPILIAKGLNPGTHRWHRVSIQWTQATKLHIVNLYGFDCKQEGYLEKNEELHRSIGADLHTLGRVPWVVGGDWNMEPEQIEGTWEIGGEVVRTYQLTHSHGKELDWFLTSRLMPIADIMQVPEQPFVGHHAIQMNLKKPGD